MVRAGLAAVPYLLRQHDWNSASRLLEQARMRDIGSPVTAQAVIPLMRRIVDATGAPDHLGMLAAAIVMADPDEAETLLRRVYDQAIDHRLASAAATNLANLLRHRGRLPEALILADRAIAHTRLAGLGSWNQLGGQALRLGILGELGAHDQVLTELPALRTRMTELSARSADNDTLAPWNVRETILDTGRSSTVALGRWEEALDFNDEVTASQLRRGASLHEIASTRFRNYPPLLGLGRLAEADQLLRDCKEVFESFDDKAMLAKVYGAHADLEYQRGHSQDAVQLARIALRLKYDNPESRNIADSHQNLAKYLSLAAGQLADQRAHRLAAALLSHFTGDTHNHTDDLQALAAELCRDTSGPDVPALPTTLPEVIRLVDADDGVRFGDLVATRCPDPDAADQALADLLARAGTLADVDLDRYLAEWDPVITVVAAVAAAGHTSTKLTDFLDQRGGTPDGAALVAALRRVLAGERNREQLLAGLDRFDTVILTATLDRIPTDPGQDP